MKKTTSTHKGCEIIKSIKKKIHSQHTYTQKHIIFFLHFTKNHFKVRCRDSAHVFLHFETFEVCWHARAYSLEFCFPVNLFVQFQARFVISFTAEAHRQWVAFRRHSNTDPFTHCHSGGAVEMLSTQTPRETFRCSFRFHFIFSF